MAITYLAQTHDYTGLHSTTTWTANKPTGTVDGNLMFAFIVLGFNTEINTVPTGWTLLASVENTNGSRAKCLVYYRVAASEPASYSWDMTGGAARNWLACEAVWTGTDVPSGVFDPNAGTTNTGTTTTEKGLAVSPAQATDMLILFEGSDNGNGNSAGPSGMTERMGLAIDGFMGQLYVYDVLLSVSGSTGDKSATSATTPVAWGTIMFALRAPLKPQFIITD